MNELKVSQVEQDILVQELAEAISIGNINQVHDILDENGEYILEFRTISIRLI